MTLTDFTVLCAVFFCRILAIYGELLTDFSEDYICDIGLR